MSVEEGSSVLYLLLWKLHDGSGSFCDSTTLEVNLGSVAYPAPENHADVVQRCQSPNAVVQTQAQSQHVSMCLRRNFKCGIVRDLRGCIPRSLAWS